MRNLIRADMRRLWKDLRLWAALAVTLGLALFIILDNAPVYAGWAQAGDDYALEDCYYNLMPLLGLIYASFVSLFLGTEQSDGILRNKLIAGHGRCSVFFSLFLTAFISCLLITAMWLIGSMPGFLYFDGFACGWGMYGLSLLIAAANAMLYAAVFATISLLIQNKAVSAVTALLLWFIMLFGGSALVNALSAPEMTCDYELIDGLWQAGQEYANPNYVTGVQRMVFEAISRIIPTCSAIRLASRECTAPAADILSSLGASALVLLGGCTVFRKKDLK